MWACGHQTAEWSKGGKRKYRGLLLKSKAARVIRVLKRRAERKEVK